MPNPGPKGSGWGSTTKMNPAWHSNLSLWLASAGWASDQAPPRPNIRSSVPPPPHHQTEQECKFPAQHHSSLPRIPRRMGQTQQFSRWVGGGLEVCKIDPLSQATHSKPLTRALPKALSENRGPPPSRCWVYRADPSTAPSTGAWPFLQSQTRANFLGWCCNKKIALCLG